MGLDDLHETINTRGYGRRATVREAGISDAAFTRHATDVGMRNTRRDLWVPAGVELSHDQRLEIITEEFPDGLLVTGASGLHVEGVIATPPQNVEVLVPSARNLRNWPATCIHRSATFEQVRAHHVGGRKVAAIPRCFADHAAHVGVDELCQDISTAIRKRRCTLGTAAMELGVRQRYPGRGRHARAIALLSTEVVHSGGERLARRLLRRGGLEFHREPLMIADAHGAAIAEIDIAFADLLLGIEIDGPHHLLPNVAAADRQRDRRLERLGWRIERFYWFEVEERGPWFVAQVQRFVAESREATGQ
jgi:hypothetical protein